MWTVVWNCVIDTFKAIYTAMNTIKIFDVWGSNYVSLWDLCVGVIVMGAIINLFINFTTPTMPDRTTSSTTFKNTKVNGEVVGVTKKTTTSTHYR